MRVKLEVYHDGESWCARGIGEDVFTQGDSLDELMDNIKEAVSLHLDDILEDGKDLHVLLLSEVEIKGATKTASG